jgi:hypothetical protein
MVETHNYPGWCTGTTIMPLLRSLYDCYVYRFYHNVASRLVAVSDHFMVNNYDKNDPWMLPT